MSALKTKKEISLIPFVKAHALNAYLVVSFLFILFVVFSYFRNYVYYLGYNNAMEYANTQVSQIEKNGYNTAFSDVIDEAQQCTPFQVEYNNRQVSLVNYECVSE